ncbi:MAG: type I phosphomannose isomerase catalytic subunit [Akkermansiaceae bacterium]
MLPITFIAIYQERVWGGRELENFYGRVLPCERVPYGESWEISDREEAQSVVSDEGGEYQGKSLNELWSDEVTRGKVFGDGLVGDRFPLLIKILDCREDLSVQVHPPTELAEELGGEAKTEMWYIAGVDEGAKLYVGLKEGVTKERFEQALVDGDVEEQIHAIEAKAGESIFIPSGRLHAIGAGHLIYEVQQNSDTTYRVFDWNRMGLDGVPRELHVEESMRCIDFDDVEPEMDVAFESCIASCEYFNVDKFELSSGDVVGNPDCERFSIVTVVSGEVVDAEGKPYVAGDFMILPRGSSDLRVSAEAVILQTTIPR